MATIRGQRLFKETRPLGTKREKLFAQEGHIIRSLQYMLPISKQRSYEAVAVVAK